MSAGTYVITVCILAALCVINKQINNENFTPPESRRWWSSQWDDTLPSARETAARRWLQCRAMADSAPRGHHPLPAPSPRTQPRTPPWQPAAVQVTPQDTALRTTKRTTTQPVWASSRRLQCQATADSAPQGHRPLPAPLSPRTQPGMPPWQPAVVQINWNNTTTSSCISQLPN